MSNEFKDWERDADDSDVITMYNRCIDNGWHREAELYKDVLIKRGLTLHKVYADGKFIERVSI